MNDENQLSVFKCKNSIFYLLGVGKYGDEGTDSKAKWGFMQKYYHKGVFYMDEDR